MVLLIWFFVIRTQINLDVWLIFALSPLSESSCIFLDINQVTFSLETDYEFSRTHHIFNLHFAVDLSLFDHINVIVSVWLQKCVIVFIACDDAH